MTIGDVMTARFDGDISDDEAILKLIELGESEVKAKQILATQDRLAAPDVFDVE